MDAADPTRPEPRAEGRARRAAGSGEVVAGGERGEPVAPVDPLEPIDPLEPVEPAGAGGGGDAGGESLVTVPNVLTFARLVSIPFFVWLLLAEDRRVAAAVYLAFMASTDWFDGWIARRYDQGTRFGKLFDPTVDRILFVVALATIIAVDGIPLWFAVAVLVREVGVGGVTMVLFALGYKPVDVVFIGKVGTFGLMVAIPLFLASTDPGFPQWAETVAWIVGIPSLVVSYASIVRYVPAWAAAVRSGSSRAVAG